MVGANNPSGARCTARPPERLGTVGELIARYQKDIIPTLHVRTGADHTAYCKNLVIAFGAMRYAKSEAEATRGDFIRSIHVTQYLRAQAKKKVFHTDGRLLADGRPVAANKEVHCLSLIFRMAKTEWGYTEYNPCLQMVYNPELARSQYHDDKEFMKVYEKASPILQCMMVSRR